MRIRVDRTCRRTPTCRAVHGPIPTGRGPPMAIAPRGRRDPTTRRCAGSRVRPRRPVVRRRLLLGSPRGLGDPLACGRPPGADGRRAQGLIKLAAAGVKVRERREPGVRTHARRAAECFAAARRQGGVHQLGLDLDLWIERALAIAENPPDRSRPARCRRHPRLPVPDRSRRLRPRSCPSERSRTRSEDRPITQEPPPGGADGQGQHAGDDHAHRPLRSPLDEAVGVQARRPARS